MLECYLSMSFNFQDKGTRCRAFDEFGKLTCRMVVEDNKPIDFSRRKRHIASMDSLSIDVMHFFLVRFSTGINSQST